MIDSFDLFAVRTSRTDTGLLEMVKTSIENNTVDYVLLLTSAKPSMLIPGWRDIFFMPPIFCYRYITERGKKTVKEFLDIQLIELENQMKARFRK